jgi:hypothetical protein
LKQLVTHSKAASRREESMPSQDYEEFIGALNAHGVRYLVVGAHAVAFHARPRATKDLDILIEPSAANAERILTALRYFLGGVDLGYTVEDVINPRWIIQLGVAPVRIDLLSEIPGLPRRLGKDELMRSSVPSQRIISDWMIS